MKADRYKTIIKILDSLYMEESNLIANLSNTAAVIKEYLGFFWVGFYLVDEESDSDFTDEEEPSIMDWSVG